MSFLFVHFFLWYPIPKMITLFTKCVMFGPSFACENNSKKSKNRSWIPRKASSISGALRTTIFCKSCKLLSFKTLQVTSSGFLCLSQHWAFSYIIVMIKTPSNKIRCCSEHLKRWALNGKHAENVKKGGNANYVAFLLFTFCVNRRLFM